MLAIGFVIGVVAWAGRLGLRPAAARARRWDTGKRRALADGWPGGNRCLVALLTAVTLYGAGFLGTSAPPPGSPRPGSETQQRQIEAATRSGTAHHRSSPLRSLDRPTQRQPSGETGANAHRRGAGARAGADPDAYRDQQVMAPAGPAKLVSILVGEPVLKFTITRIKA